jgi:hypothetical protein
MSFQYCTFLIFFSRTPVALVRLRKEYLGSDRLLPPLSADDLATQLLRHYVRACGGEVDGIEDGEDALALGNGFDASLEKKMKLKFRDGIMIHQFVTSVGYTGCSQSPAYIYFINFNY